MKFVKLNFPPEKIAQIQLRTLSFFLSFFFLLQILFWYHTEKIKPKVQIVPEPPTELKTQALSFGDKQFYYRTQGFKVQNMGDTFGRFSPLKNYNYKKLYHWFSALDKLDEKSGYLPALSAYYYSQTQNTQDTKYIIQYLEEHSDKDTPNNWWWYYQALYIANYVYGDSDWAFRLAKKLAKSSDDAPIWTKQMIAFLYKDYGDDCTSIRIINELKQDLEKSEKEQNIKEKELNFMIYFIARRVNELKKKGFNPNKCY